jgi:hypothetical protein
MPSVSEFDAGRYDQDVLDPARKAGNVPPPDLLVRYAIPSEAERDAAAFETRVAEVVEHWRAAGQKHKYKNLASALLAAHADLADANRLKYGYFAERRRDVKKAALEKLESMVTELAATTTVVPRAKLSSLHAEFGGVITEEALQAKLAEHHVTVIDRPWDLPQRPQAQCASLASNLRILGLELAAEVVFGTGAVRDGFRLRRGFRLADGSHITAKLLEEKKHDLGRRAHDERQTARWNVLSTLSAAAGRQADLDALLLWQLIDHLQRLVALGLPIRSITSAAAGLGLDPGEAAELALALSDQRGEVKDPISQEVEAALAAGDIGRAERLVAGLPEDAGDLRKRVEAQVSALEAKLDDARAAQQDGRTEDAAELLTKVIEATGDTDGRLGAWLRSLPPPPPGRVLAEPDGASVHLQWRPGSARTGGIRYRVVRSECGPAETPAAGSRVAETAATEAADDKPPCGETLHYTVFATRGEAWSDGAAAPEVIVLPEVAAPELEAGESSVLGSWRIAQGTVGVIVTRAEGSPPPSGGGQPITASLEGFEDTGVRAGVRYFYRVCAVYNSSGGETRVTPGIVRSATPEAALSAVKDLRLESPSSAGAQLSLAWTAPQAGAISIHRHSKPLPWPPGTAISLADLTRYSRPVPGVPVCAAGETGRMAVNRANGRCYLTAMTVGASGAVVGATVAMAVMMPVTGLRARRFGHRLRLEWQWPDECHVCQIRWWCEGDPPGAATVVECALRRYTSDGHSFEIAVGPRPATVSVRAIHRDTEGEIASSPAEITMPAEPAALEPAAAARHTSRRQNRWARWPPLRWLFPARRAR